MIGSWKDTRTEGKVVITLIFCVVVVVAGDVNLPKSHLLLEQDDEYSCKDDVEKDCAVYAGCVALIDDSFS